VIARIWHGYTKAEHAAAYKSMLKPELLPRISEVKGYRGSYLLRREASDDIEFVTTMLWDSVDATGLSQERTTKLESSQRIGANTTVASPCRGPCTLPQRTP